MPPFKNRNFGGSRFKQRRPKSDEGNEKTNGRNSSGQQKQQLSANSLFNRVSKKDENSNSNKPKNYKKIENNTLYQAINNKARVTEQKNDSGPTGLTSNGIYNKNDSNARRSKNYSNRSAFDNSRGNYVNGIPTGPRSNRIHTKNGNYNDFNKAKGDDKVRRNAEGNMSFKGSHSRRNNSTNSRKYDNENGGHVYFSPAAGTFQQPQFSQQGPKLEFSIKHASLPPIVLFKNLERGTTAQDVKTILEYVGPVSDSRAVYDPESDSIRAEAVFENKEHSYIAVDQFNGSVADGREITAEIIKVHGIPNGENGTENYVDNVEINNIYNDSTNIIPPVRAQQRDMIPSQTPAYVNKWEGPTLYSDTVTRRSGSRPSRQ